MFRRIFCLSLLLVASPLWAQNISPTIIIENADHSGRVREHLRISELSVDVKIRGHLAETRMEMKFYNPQNRALAGDLYFPLPEGATISGYALDIEGVMIDGVVVEKNEGRRVFEKIVRQGIDPGLVEWTKGNNFKTRVFPIPARGHRTIMLKYITELKDDDALRTYYLPMNFSKAIAKATIRMEVIKSQAKPILEKSGMFNVQFNEWNDSYVAEATLTNTVLNQDLKVSIPWPSQTHVLVEEGDDGVHYFCIFDRPHKPAVTPPIIPERVKIFWDASSSRGGTDHSVEFKVLDEFFQHYAAQIIDVELVLFRHRQMSPEKYIIRNGDAAELIKRLKNVMYDGGTQLGALDPGEGTLPDFYFIFSDGLSTYGREESVQFERPVYLFSDDVSVNHSILRYVAAGSGGHYFNLKNTSAKEAVAAIGRRPFGLRNIRKPEKTVTDVFPSIFTPVVRNITIVGKLLDPSATVTLDYQQGDSETQGSTLRILRKKAVRGNLLQKYWAQKKLNELMVRQKENRDEIIDLGKEYGIVTPGTSLIVLDSVNQYVEHEIFPPDSRKDWQKQYEEIVATRQKSIMQDEEDNLNRVVTLWKTRVHWWNKRFLYPDNFRYNNSKKGKGGSDDMLLFGAGSADTEAVPTGSARRESIGDRFGGSLDDVMMDLDASVTKKEKAAAPSISIEPWNPQTPYLKKLETAENTQLFETYMVLKKEYGEAPSFYIDCSDYLLERNQTDLAIQVLSNIAELELEEPTLLRVLAHKLAQLGMIDMSILLFEEVLRLRPEEPQSYRDLALVLEKNKEYERAAALLYEVATRKWDRFNEIELIALLEMNHILPRLNDEEIADLEIDKRLIKHLDLDIRIVMTWHADMTDIDLWVTEPSAEKAFYSHPNTTIGGKVSRDFTNGYGPEEYLLRRAMKGKYKVQANYYGSRAPKMLGPVTLQLDIITNYGRENEEIKTVTRRLESKKEVISVSELEF